MKRLLALLLAFALLAPGCSLMTRRSPSKPVDDRFEPVCSEGKAPIVTDVVFAVIYGTAAVGALLLINGRSATQGDKEDYAGAAVVFGGTGALFTASAVHGNVATNKCRDLRARWIADLEQLHAAPPGFEGGLCRTRIPSCDPGLACASGYCVLPPPGVESDDVKQQRQADRDRKRQVATQLAAKARAAASNGDCETVRSIEKQIRAVDVDVHAKLVANPAIQRCQATPEPKPEPGPAPDP